MGLTSMWVKGFAGIVGAMGIVLAMAPVASADPPPAAEEMHALPKAEGHFDTNLQGDFYRVYFKTPDGRFCGILPNGGPVGCDAVPRDAPEGSNQTVVKAGFPAEYKHADTPFFTRDVDVLPVGYRLENWGASCGLVREGVLTCTTYGSHGFTITADHGELW